MGNTNKVAYKATDLYDSCAWDEREVKKLVSSGALAGRVKGVEDVPTGSGVPECPICMLYYEGGLNELSCCKQGICTECYLQVKPPRAEGTCPFCNRDGINVTYTKPSDEDRRREAEAAKRLAEARARSSSVTEERMRKASSPIAVGGSPSATRRVDGFGSSLSPSASPFATVEERRRLQKEALRASREAERERALIQAERSMKAAGLSPPVRHAGDAGGAVSPLGSPPSILHGSASPAGGGRMSEVEEMVRRLAALRPGDAAAADAAAAAGRVGGSGAAGGRGMSHMEHLEELMLMEALRLSREESQRSTSVASAASAASVDRLSPLSASSLHSAPSPAGMDDDMVMSMSPPASLSPAAAAAALPAAAGGGGGGGGGIGASSSAAASSYSSTMSEEEQLALALSLSLASASPAAASEDDGAVAAAVAASADEAAAADGGASASKEAEEDLFPLPALPPAPSDFAALDAPLHAPLPPPPSFEEVVARDAAARRAEALLAAAEEAPESSESAAVPAPSAASRADAPVIVVEGVAVDVEE